MGSAKKAAGPVTKTYCPCCPEWEIKQPERCSNTLSHGARTFDFCSRRCKERFERDPVKYLEGTA